MPSKEYPYLAVWVGNDSTADTLNVEQKDLVLISMVNSRPYIQYILGGREGYFTDAEEEYYPFPKGYILTLTQ